MRNPTKRLVFSKGNLEKIPPSEHGRVVYHDLKVPDLTLRVEPSGRKTFIWLRKGGGRAHFKSIGEFPATSIEEARGEAQRYSGDLARLKRDGWQGVNPFERRPGEPTLAELFEDYCARHLRQHCKRPEAAEQHARWVFEPHLGVWRDRKLSQITRKDVLSLHESIGEKHGRTMSNRVMQLLRATFGFAERTELWSGPNPVSKVRLFAETKRERFLQPDELARFLRALRHEGNHDLRDFCLLSLWTAARKADVLSMRWADVRLDDNAWSVSDPKGEAYQTPLVPEAIQVLRDRLRTRRDESPWVFPGSGKSGHLASVKKPWQRLLARAQIVNFHVHDMRRTRASWQAAQGTSLLIIGKSLGHKSAAATLVYARLNLDNVRASVESAVTAMVAAGKKPKQLKGGGRG